MRDWPMTCSFRPARVLYAADGGPWKGLHPRDSALLTRAAGRFPVLWRGEDRQVRRARLLPAGRPAHAPRPDRGQPQCRRSLRHGHGVWRRKRGCTLDVQLEGMRLAVDGKLSGKKEVRLPPGKHLLLAFVSTMLRPR